MVVTDRQTPAPSHVRCGVNVDPTQVPAAHCVPAAQNRQAPAPLHMPSNPQVFIVVATHWVAGVGAVPFGTGVQVPCVPVSAQDRHVPVQALLQQ